MKEECWHVIFHFRDYKEAKALLDANWNLDADRNKKGEPRIWKIELRTVRE